MDLVGVAIGLQRVEMTSRVQYAVARKILNNQQMQGASAVKLIEAAGTATLQAGDALVAAATGLGGKLDIFA
jgi:hypothetical protein